MSIDVYVLRMRGPSGTGVRIRRVNRWGRDVDEKEMGD